MSWVRPDREILPQPSTRTSERSTEWCGYGGSQSEASTVDITMIDMSIFINWNHINLYTL